MDNYVSTGTVRDVQVILVSIIFLEVNLTIEHRVKTELPFLWQNLKLRWILMFGCSSSKKKKKKENLHKNGLHYINLGLMCTSTIKTLEKTRSYKTNEKWATGTNYKNGNIWKYLTASLSNYVETKSNTSEKCWRIVKSQTGGFGSVSFH